MQHDVYGSLKWRNIGPHRGGRVVAVAGDPVDPATFYFGACAGGVWKTEDAGSHWFNVSDGYFNTAAIGALDVARSDPNVIYAGTGEASIRSNVSHGDGVYKSTDAGQTWRTVGLQDTRHIGRIAIHPEDPDTVYVAALGHAWGRNAERGVFRTTNGGETWDRVLFKSDRAGAIDLSLDQTNPRTLYAAIWQVQRYPWSIESGGEDSGIWKSTDGGDTWTELTTKPGLPEEKVLGKIGITASPAQPGRVWALIEADKGGLYRSDDGGEHWECVNSENALRTRPWYYTHVHADPGNADTVWVLDQQFVKSIDGGKTFDTVPTPHGDNHAIWIDPLDPDRIIEGNDGGACISFNRCKSWSTILNQPTAQFYHVTVDNQTPYNVYGSQQDNSAMRVPSIGFDGSISWNDYRVPGGGESGHIAVRPTPPYTVFGGSVGSGLGHGRFRAWNPETRQTRNISVWPEFYGFNSPTKIHKYRFQWTFPVEVSPHNPDKLYACSNVVHVSYDEGGSWEVISGDLTRNDENHQQLSGGPITSENVGAEAYCTIFAFKESPHEEGVLYAGSDDGLIHISKDGGAIWTNITPAGDLLPNPPENPSRISIIDVSPHDPAKVYVAANRYQHDDTRPYLLKSADYGQTWQTITAGIPENDFTRTIREDTSKPGILYAGTETGVYVSLDDGESWTRLQTTLPVAPIHDLVVKDTDLVVASHGRSFWILDDVTPLHQLQDGIDTDIHLYKPRDAVRYRISPGFGQEPKAAYVGYRASGPVTVASRQVRDADGELETKLLNAGENPPDGVIIHYYLAEKPEGEVKLTIKDSAGAVLKTFSTEGEEGSKLTVKAGANRFVWDMRASGATQREDDQNLPPWRRFMMRMAAAPRVVSGEYSVELEAGTVTRSQSFSILPDPRLSVSADDLRAQYELKVAIRDAISDINERLNALAQIRVQANGWATRANNEEITQAAEALSEKITVLEDQLRTAESVSTKGGENGLNEKLSVLAMAIDESDHAPTAQAREVFGNLNEDLATVRYQVQRLIEDDVAAFTAKLTAAGVPLISTTPIEATVKTSADD
jgi:photosystem II stability/assembly factor-like uncharacterized protein